MLMLSISSELDLCRCMKIVGLSSQMKHYTEESGYKDRNID